MRKPRKRQLVCISDSIRRRNLKAETKKLPSTLVDVIRFCLVGVIAGVFSSINFYDVRARMFTALDFCYDVPPRNILSSTNVVMLVASSGTVILASYLCHTFNPFHLNSLKAFKSFIVAGIFSSSPE